MAREKILLFDSDPGWTQELSSALIRQDFEVFSALTVTEAVSLLNAHAIDAVIVDINSTGADPIGLLEQIRQQFSQTTIIVCTSRATIPQAVRTIKLGAHDYIAKNGASATMPAVCDSVRRALNELGTPQRAARATAPSRGELMPSTQGFYGLISENARMHDVFELIQTIADSNASVLIQGETGTGKELVAHAIYEASNRHGKPFVTLDCSTLARELLESELFGHEKGAFTGAFDRHIGRFERANGGTLFLDEVLNMDLTTQSKLLRVIQTQTFERVGGTKAITVDVRIIAASNRSLEHVVTEGTFREDLFHRLNVVQIEVPPLRERVEDVSLLAREFLRRFSRQNNKPMRGFTDAAIDMLGRYNWPGNVRELENVVLQAVVLAKSQMLDAGDLPKRIAQSPAVLAGASPVRLADQLGEPEKQILINALRQHSGNIKRCAEALQISRTTLYAKLKKYEIDPDGIR